MSVVLPIDLPVSPDAFKGRTALIQQICERLEHALSSSALVGGPRTGGTSLLRFMASPHAVQQYPTLAKSLNVYIQGETIGSTIRPAQFWARCFGELSRQVMSQSLQVLVADTLEKARKNTLDAYNLEDAFDAFAQANSPVVLFIDDFDKLLRNENFWPPMDDFFHSVRSLGRRVPRGLAFVIKTPREIYDLWDTSRSASPFYNILDNMAIGRLEEQHSREIVREWFARLGLPCDPSIENLVVAASENHAYLVRYVTSLCAEMRQTGTAIQQSTLVAKFREPGGPVVTLIRQMRDALTLTERRWLDTLQGNPAQVTQVQKELLRKLWDYGLIPPGVKIP